MGKSERLPVTACLLPAHKAVLEQLAQVEDTSAATIVRRLIRAEGERRGIWPIVGETHTGGGARR